MSFIKKIIALIIIIFFLGAGAVTYKINLSNHNIWLSDYLFNSPSYIEPEGTVDLIVTVVDHWEPAGNTEILYRWMRDYRKLADKHIDSDGVKFQHDWSYPIEQFRGYEIDSIVQLCIEGYGDLGIQLHHQNDTPESLREKLLNGIDSMQAHGALISPDEKTYYSFVHGNWALDNSIIDGKGKNACGVNTEIDILIETGCFCDVTFPALLQTAQPSLINKIFYATDDPKPKSHNTGQITHVGYEPDVNELMIFQGPAKIDWSDWRYLTHPVIDFSIIYGELPASIHRFELWIDAYVHVEGQPNWVFIRPHTHGANINGGGIEANLGEDIDLMLTQIERKYRNNEKYRLHYMTVRESYNVINAAEDGLVGNPNQYRNYKIKPYIYGKNVELEGDLNE